MMRHRETSDRELFRKNAAFNVKQRQSYDPQQKARDAGKEARNAKISRSKRQERVVKGKRLTPWKRCESSMRYGQLT
jgi:hypothetical protein